MQKVQQLAAENRELHTRLDDTGSTDATPAGDAGRAPLGPEECARRILHAGAAAPRR